VRNVERRVAWGKHQGELDAEPWRDPETVKGAGAPASMNWVPVPVTVVSLASIMVVKLPGIDEGETQVPARATVGENPESHARVRMIAMIRS
jgi:hypothetical protein